MTNTCDIWRLSAMDMINSPPPPTFAPIAASSACHTLLHNVVPLDININAASVKSIVQSRKQNSPKNFLDFIWKVMIAIWLKSCINNGSILCIIASKHCSHTCWSSVDTTFNPRPPKILNLGLIPIHTLEILYSFTPISKLLEVLKNSRGWEKNSRPLSYHYSS